MRVWNSHFPTSEPGASLLEHWATTLFQSKDMALHRVRGYVQARREGKTGAGREGSERLPLSKEAERMATLLLRDPRILLLLPTYQFAFLNIWVQVDIFRFLLSCCFSDKITKKTRVETQKCIFFCYRVGFRMDRMFYTAYPAVWPLPSWHLSLQLSRGKITK